MLYLLLLPVLAWYIIFCYLPIAGGISLSLRNFQFNLGIWKSPFVGLAHFRKMLGDPDFLRATKNTIIISLGRIAFQMPCAILVAVFLNEIRSPKWKRTFQTVITFPHFISWVVLAGILSNLIGSSGIINQFLGTLGLESISPITTASSFRLFIWLSNIWKEVGWDSIIYLAAITSIDPGLYEAAEVDGASRMQRIRHITLPGIKSTIAIMLILAVGQIMTNGSFDRIFNLFFMTLILFTMLFSGGLVPTYMIVKGLGLIKNIWVMILPTAISTYYMIIMKNYFMNLPAGLIEAAKLDGASEWTILWKVAIPISKPFIATFALFYSVERWNEWYNALLYINQKDLAPLQIYLRETLVSLSGQLSVQAKQMLNATEKISTSAVQMATIIITAVPIICVYPLLQKYFVNGIMVGGLKE